MNLPADLALKVRAAAHARGQSVSALLAIAVTKELAADLQNDAASLQEDLTKVLTLSAAIYSKTDELIAELAKADEKNIARFKSIAAGLEQLSRR
jgi:hypothetical protein